jgi:hypothetical protein
MGLKCERLELIEDFTSVENMNSINWARKPFQCQKGVWGTAFFLSILAVTGLTALRPVCAAENARPVFIDVRVDPQSQSLIISTQSPPGYRHAVLEAGSGQSNAAWMPLIAGQLDGVESALIYFTLPLNAMPTSDQFLRARVGWELDPPMNPRWSGAEYFRVEPLPANGATGSLIPETSGPNWSEASQIGHLLNRIAYGPSPSDFAAVQSQGIQAFVDNQLNPGNEPEPNSRLQSHLDDLFEDYQPSEDTYVIRAGETWFYFKGTQEPPSNWRQPDFNPSSWLSGPSGFGYGDGDDETELEDMEFMEPDGALPGQPGYLSLFIRKNFFVNELDSSTFLVLSMDYDDSFVAYLNGQEIARSGVTGVVPRYNQTAQTGHEAGDPEDWIIENASELLQIGENVLTIQGHNVSRTSSDFSLIPELIIRRPLDLPTQHRIRGIQELKEIPHIIGSLSKRQLQATLAEFWENHFTTDFDKVAEYLQDELENSDGLPAMGESQARSEAAQMEYAEYRFFYENALGYFGDLLLYSATSPTQLIYLDNVLNVKGAPNENYAREFFELFAFGVDNRYTQRDIEVLSKCFTGWTIRKSWPNDVADFPVSALAPPTSDSVQVEDQILLGLGAGWKYFKGTKEPSPERNGSPGLDWTQPDFNDGAWTSGSTGIGYGDGDDATLLNDMRNNYSSVYIRRKFSVADVDSLEGFGLRINYDDGYVAYLNGVEIGRSPNMAERGSPPPFNATAAYNREAVVGAEDFISLATYRSILLPAPEANVLAIQGHNVTLNSSDFSLLPELIERKRLPGSIENGDPNGVWTFRFDPSEHDLSAKTLFEATAWETTLPSNRRGSSGLLDALDVINLAVNHPSTQEFICIKLIQKFVSDEMNLESYHNGSAPEDLMKLMSRALSAWNSTQPVGHIATVMRAILDPETQSTAFWNEEHRLSKVKSSIEYINSVIRALEADLTGAGLPELNAQLGMELFTRDDPDGWPEYGGDWMNTSMLLERVKFAQRLSAGQMDGIQWTPTRLLANNNLNSAEDILNYFESLLFQGAMHPSVREALREYADTDDQGNPSPLTSTQRNFLTRAQELIALILSMPEIQKQ